jgi:type VI secretion system protein ImpM
VPADAVTLAPGTASLAAPGFYGKLPARGDFIGRRLGRSFIDAWDGWLQEALLASKTALGPQWLEIYLTSPVWHFALGAGCCGPNAVAGLVMPSVDSVGRYFPLMLGAEFPAGRDLAQFVPVSAWYQALEDLALSALSEGFDLDRFEQPIPLPAPNPTGRSPASPEALTPPGRHIALADGSLADLCRDHADAIAIRRTLWWTSGSERVSPCLLICPGLPPPAAFPALLDGAWPSHGWLTAGPSATADQDLSVPPATAGGALDWDREE